MIKIGETGKQVFVFLIIFGPFIFGQNIVLSMGLYAYQNDFFYTNLLVFFGFFTKLFSGIFEIILQKGFQIKLKEPSPLTVKDYVIYILIIVLEVLSLLLNINYYILNAHLFKNVYLFASLTGLQLFIISILSFCIFQLKFGKHRIIGLVFITIGLLFIIPIYVFQLNKVLTSKEIIIFCLTQLGIVFIGGIVEVLQKYLLLVKHQSPYKMLFIIGLFQCLSMVYFLIDSFLKWKATINFESGLVLIIGIVVQGAYHYMRLVINYKFTPAHRSTSDYISAIIMFIFSYCYESNWVVVLGVLGYCICLFGSLIYNEIIIIGVFNIDKDTIDKIQQRGLIEEVNDKKYLSEEYKKRKQLIETMISKENII